MKKLHNAFWISFAVYSTLTFLGAIIVERNQNDLGFLINMKGYIPLMKYYSLVGLVFYAVAFLLMWRNRFRFNKTSDRFDKEKKELKAAIIDLQEKNSTPVVDDTELDSSKPEE